jgi:SPP1 gp7 family putative phage head morphogenesis protein
MAELSQEERIRRAVQEAVKVRDRYAEDRVDELLKTLSKASGDVASQLKRFEDKFTLKPWQHMRKTVLKDLEKEIVSITKDLEKSWKVGVKSNVEGAMTLGIDDGIRQLEILGMPDFQDLTDISRTKLLKRTFSTIDRSAVDFLVNYQVQLLGDVSTELASGIKNSITHGVLAGKSIPEVARDIGRLVKTPDAFRKTGRTAFKTAQRRATLIARTETLRAHNEGRKKFYLQAGIKKVKWMTADDARTCNPCRALDGKVLGVDEVQGPPSHPACRCTLSFCN